MKHLVGLAAALVLAACAPVVITPGPIGPAELARYSDSATNTAAAAAALATQDARTAGLATAQGVSARETATAVTGATLGALSGQQTAVALQLTAGAGAALATDSAGVRTQAAAQTQAWSTPTAAAMATQAWIASVEGARQRAQSESVAEFWSSFRFICLALLIVGGLVAIAIVAIAGLARIRLATVASQATIAREAFRLLSPGHWAEWAPGEGYQVYELPGLLSAPPIIVENTAPALNQVHAWRQAVRLFAWWGNMYGFGIRDLGPAGAGVVTDPAYRRLAKLLREAGVLADVVVDGQAKTGWAPDWHYRRFADELGHAKLVLPFPLSEDPPKVHFTVPTQHPTL